MEYMTTKTMKLETIIEKFRELTKQIIIDIDNASGKKKLINQYRLRSILNTIKVLEKINKPVIGIEDLEEIKKLKGIGEGSIRRIKEIIETGKLDEIKITSTDVIYLKMMNELEEIYGIGRATAYKMLKEHNIRSIDELKEKIEKGEIKVSDNILKGIKYINKIDTKIPREEIDEIHEYLLDTLLELDANLFGTICGSYRRLKPYSGDVDFILVHTDYKKRNERPKHNYLEIFINKLIKNEFIIDSLTKIGVETKYMGIFKWKNDKYRRIDIRFIPMESYYPAILYFTGSKDFNKRMRLNAIAQDYTLNEYGLFDKKGKMFKVKSEKDIFDLLGMEYITPDKRN